MTPELIIPVEIFSLIVSIATAIMSQGLVKSVKLYSHMRMAIFILLATIINVMILFSSILLVVLYPGQAEPDYMPFARAVSQALTVTGMAIAVSILRQGQVTEINPLMKKAHFDALTQLYRKDSFNIIADKRFKEAVEKSTNLSLIVFDIDHFKQYNDSFGHLAGDYALRAVAQAAASSLRDDDVLARWGGEEFAVLLAEAPETAWIVAERLRGTIQSKCNGEADEEIKREITVSVGVTCLIGCDNCVPDMFSRADKALYVSKNNGRNQSTIIQAQPA